ASGGTRRVKNRKETGGAIAEDQVHPGGILISSNHLAGRRVTQYVFGPVFPTHERGQSPEPAPFLLRNNLAVTGRDLQPRGRVRLHLYNAPSANLRSGSI